MSIICNLLHNIIFKKSFHILILEEESILEKIKFKIAKEFGDNFNFFLFVKSVKKVTKHIKVKHT